MTRGKFVGSARFVLIFAAGIMAAGIVLGFFLASGTQNIWLALMGMRSNMSFVLGLFQMIILAPLMTALAFTLFWWLASEARNATEEADHQRTATHRRRHKHRPEQMTGKECERQYDAAVSGNRASWRLPPPG